MHVKPDLFLSREAAERAANDMPPDCPCDDWSKGRFPWLPTEHKRR